MKIYLASNYYSNPQMREVATELKGAGHEVICEWIQGIHNSDQHEDYALIDLRDLEAADALVLFTHDFNGSRVRGGKHVEFGYALAKGKRLYIVGERKNVFHFLPQVTAVESVGALLEVL